MITDPEQSRLLARLINSDAAAAWSTNRRAMFYRAMLTAERWSQLPRWIRDLADAMRDAR